MRLVDEQHTRTPFYGVARVRVHLHRLGHGATCKRVRRLLQEMGLETVFARPKTSTPAPSHAIYPYLLRGLTIERPDHV